MMAFSGVRNSWLILARKADLARLAFSAWAAEISRRRDNSFMLAREVSAHSYPEIGVSDSHHPLSHHQDEAAKLERLHKINEYHFRQFAYLVKRLAAMPERGLLYAAGLSLVHEDGMLSLVERETGLVRTSLATPPPPMPVFAVDLEAGPLRDALRELTDLRALLPLVQVQARERRMSVLDSEPLMVRMFAHAALGVPAARLELAHLNLADLDPTFAKSDAAGLAAQHERWNVFAQNLAPALAS